MSSSSLDNEDLDNVPLVRMEDVQPSRERAGVSLRSKDDSEVYETCIIDDINYENECVVNVNDDDSNIDSMVSLQSEDVYEDHSSNQELIIPECLEEVVAENERELEIYIDNEESDFAVEYIEDPIEDDCEIQNEVELEYNKGIATKHKHLNVAVDHDSEDEFLDSKLKIKPKDYMSNTSKTTTVELIEVEVPPNKKKRVDGTIATSPSDSWPTLEILPGGVIKNTDKYESESSLRPDKIPETVSNSGEMTYACAKCSQTFKFLLCLVKHVKWHEDQQKTVKDTKGDKMRVSSKEYICLHSDKKNIV